MLKVDGFGIALYRSFGESIQCVGPLSKVNLIIGQNNSGKSNILRFATEHLRGLVHAALHGKAYKPFKDLDEHHGAGGKGLAFAYGLDPGGKAAEEAQEKLHDMTARKAFDKLLKAEALAPEGDIAWFRFEGNQGQTRIETKFVKELIESKLLNQQEWSALHTGLNRTHSSGDFNNLVTWTLHAVARVALERVLPNVALVPAIRKVNPDKNVEEDFSGRGLIERLAKLEKPDHANQALKKKFEAVNVFLREVTGVASAAIEIPYARDTILTHIEGRTLPLEALGTGIHEVVILAAAATTISDYLVCMEEPEIHLHPILQRKLLAYLQESTDNQYLIATHSSHFMDAREANIFHVQLREGQTLVKTARTDFERFDICTDLGYRASDLLQANCIIWVEGPSDRIYLRHWIERVAPGLVEGLHYSIMFYGGRLLSHLTAEDPEVKAFISLRRLNRHVGILIDSDRAKADQPLNATKERVRKELPSGKCGFAWVTAGREIENYIPAPDLERAVRECHNDFARLPRPTQYENLLRYHPTEGKRKAADKVKVACNVIQRMPSMDVLDLKSQLESVVNFIKKANQE